MRLLPLGGLAALALMIPALARPAAAQTFYVDTASIINFAIPATDLYVGFNNASPFVAELRPGGSVPGELDLWNNATLRMTGGSVGTFLLTAKRTTLYMSGGTVGVGLWINYFNFPDVENEQRGQLFMSGGSVSGHVTSSGRYSTVSVTGGSIAAWLRIFGANAYTQLSGGSVGGSVQISGGLADVTGGTVAGYLLANYNATLNWKGGQIATAVQVDHNATINVFGSNLNLVSVAPFTYQLSGVLADGTPINAMTVFKLGAGRVNLVNQGSSILRVTGGNLDVVGHNGPGPTTTVNLVIRNSGTSPAQNVVVNNLVVGLKTAPAIPVGTIGAGQTAGITYTFLNTDVAGLLPQTVTVSGRMDYTGGTVGFSRRVTAN